MYRRAVFAIAGEGTGATPPATPVPGADGAGSTPAAPPAPAAEPPPLAEPAPASGNWRDGLPEALRTNPSIESTTSVESLAQQFTDLQAHMGTALRLPGPDAGPEAVKQFHEDLVGKAREHGVNVMPTPDTTNPEVMSAIYDSLGRPTEAAKYTRPQIEGLTEVDQSRDQAFAELSHETGLSQRQFEQVYQGMMSWEMGQARGQADGIAAEIGELKQEWGYTFDQRFEAMAGFLTQMKMPQSVIDAVAAKNIPREVAQGFYNMVDAFSGGNLEIAGQGTQPRDAGLDQAEALAQAQEIQNNPDYRHHDITVRQPLIDKYQKLMAQAAGPDGLTGKAAADDLRTGSSRG